MKGSPSEKALVAVRDVAHVRDGYALQTNIVSQNRVRSALLTVLKGVLLRGHMEEIDTSLGRTLNDGPGSAGGPRAESGGLPDSSSSGGKEDFAAGGRKGHASRVRPTTGILGAILGFFFAIHECFNRGFEKIRDRTGR